MQFCYLMRRQIFSGGPSIPATDYMLGHGSVEGCREIGWIPGLADLRYRVSVSQRALSIFIARRSVVRSLYETHSRSREVARLSFCQALR